MKMTINELRTIIKDMIIEAKKKKVKKDKLDKKVNPPAYTHADALDFSSPLGGYNLYASQGAVNWGPMTGPGSKIDDNVATSYNTNELKEFIQRATFDGLIHNDSAWKSLAESLVTKDMKFNTIWEVALYQYNNSGKQIDELSRRKGVKYFKVEK